MKITHTADHRELRQIEYPPIEDFADAVYWSERGDRSKLEAWLARCDAVKAKYPAPPSVS